MQPGDKGTNMQDSVVGGNVHTGNVIHNHYHGAPPVQDARFQQPPQSVVLSQPAVGIGAQTGIHEHQKTQATTALVLAILAAIMCVAAPAGICFAIPGLIVANSALSITKQVPGHPDAGWAKAAQIISWCVIGISILWIVFISVMMATI